MTGAPEGSPKVVLCGFMEKPGIEPATPGLQGIALIHYTMGASQINTGKQCWIKVLHYREQLIIYIYKLILNTLGLA